MALNCIWYLRGILCNFFAMRLGVGPNHPPIHLVNAPNTNFLSCYNVLTVAWAAVITRCCDTLLHLLLERFDSCLDRCYNKVFRHRCDIVTRPLPRNHSLKSLRIAIQSYLMTQVSIISARKRHLIAKSCSKLEIEYLECSVCIAKQGLTQDCVNT